MQSKGGLSVVQVRTVYLFLTSIQGERQFLKVFHNYTILTTSFNGRNPTQCPNSRNSTIVLLGPISNPQHHGRNSTSRHHGRTPISTVCLHAPKSTPNRLFFKVFKF